MVSTSSVFLFFPLEKKRKMPCVLLLQHDQCDDHQGVAMR